MQQLLDKIAPQYIEKYGHAPKFKAGIHHGEVMAGEVGIIKRDIIYSGDVLNTTARIQEKCNDYHVTILLSKDSFELVKDEVHFGFHTLGEILLRGKQKRMEIGTILT